MPVRTRCYFWAKQCPMQEGCSNQSWKKAQRWGDAAEACRAQVVKHLMTSGHHNLNHADAVELANMVDIMEGTYEEEESGELTRARKRRAIGARGEFGALEASAPEATSMGSSSTGIVPATSSGYIYFRQHEFQAALDCVNRAANSAGQAQRLAAAAARAFGDELAALNEVKANLETIQQGAEVFQ